jgi:predicted XRE-type DNA-binding protein
MTGTIVHNIWDALEDDSIVRENMKIRSQLMVDIKRLIVKRGWSQLEAAEHLGINQPRVSLLMNGKINKFRVDTLIDMAARAGLHVEMTIAEAA